MHRKSCNQKRKELDEGLSYFPVKFISWNDKNYNTSAVGASATGDLDFDLQQRNKYLNMVIKYSSEKQKKEIKSIAQIIISFYNVTFNYYLITNLLLTGLDLDLDRLLSLGGDLSNDRRLSLNDLCGDLDLLLPLRGLSLLYRGDLDRRNMFLRRWSL